MRIAIASDHAGFAYKEKIKQRLVALNHQPRDFGAHCTDLVDYPDFIHPATAAVAKGEFDRGIVLGGSGNGEAMTANRHPGIRCALCWSFESARLSRQHNDANLLSLGERLIDLELALQIVEVWLTTPFENGRHVLRIRKIDEGAK
ncbi:Putative sugar phosphate isomerase YwlF [Bremerella volcania]|uniref:Sugar phosphate isomerase YwlF n=1 Tax=Bremerella volcania TaxID=2527984 RepID=A0A518C5W7_9BACT|nr:ribose 5-phosphate isomerase B [Bremerella volcania]QDU74602.1 Putative sugar phosphate isomerase YwlF [Bremerella volcania]